MLIDGNKRMQIIPKSGQQLEPPRSQLQVQLAGPTASNKQAVNRELSAGKIAKPHEGVIEIFITTWWHLKLEIST
jgi:hypothetical protein